MLTFIPFEEARRIVIDSVSTMESESVSLDYSLRRTLSEGIVSHDTIPPFDNSAMDGFAVVRSDVLAPPVELRVVADIPAGTPWAGRLEKGSCARIMTGAPVPEGADAIVPVEQTRRLSTDAVLIKTKPAKSAHIRRSGEDIQEGDVVFESGMVITPGVVGLLATLGIAAAPVRKRPSIAIISTGDEVVPAEVVPGPGQIRNSNGPALAAQAISAGGEVSRVLHAADNQRSIRDAAEQGGEADVLLFAGGVSMGEHDHVLMVLREMGARWLFWKVKQRPGKPLAFGIMNGKPVLGLPGNPVSASMCFEMYARPMLAAMLGRRQILRDVLPARLTRPMKKVRGLYYFARGIMDEHGKDGGRSVRDTGPQGSHLFSSVARANCIIHLSEDIEDPAVGDRVFVERLQW